MKARVFENSDGTLQVVKLNPKRQREGESDADFEARLFSRHVEQNSLLIQKMIDAGKPLPRPALAGLPFSDVEVNILPTDRSKRYAWRRQGNAVVVDPTVQPPPHPRQTLLDEIEAATSIAELKASLLKVIRGS